MCIKNFDLSKKYAKSVKHDYFVLQTSFENDLRHVKPMDIGDELNSYYFCFVEVLLLRLMFDVKSIVIYCYFVNISLFAYRCLYLPCVLP